MADAQGLRPIKIGLLWHSASSANLGVGALTIADMSIAREVAHEMGLDPRFLIIGMRDGAGDYDLRDAAETFVVDRASLLSPGGCWRVMGEQDCVIDIGAGDSFADIYGPTRFFFLWLTKMISIARGTPLLLAPQTIGPFTKPAYRPFAKVAMEGAYAVVARDHASLDFLNDIAPKARGVLSADVALALPYDDESAKRGGKVARVGVNVSGLLFNEAESGKNHFGLDANYADLTRQLIAELIRRPDTEPHLIVHVRSPIGGWDDDADVANRLMREFPQAIRAPDFVGPCEAKSYISGLDFLVAGRMHACIAALSSGVPVAPVAYSRKFSGLFEMLGYPWMVPVRGMGTEEALAYVVDCLERRGELAKATQTSMVRGRELHEAYKAELRKLFTAALAR